MGWDRDFSADGSLGPKILGTRVASNLSMFLSDQTLDPRGGHPDLHGVNYREPA